MTKTVTTKLCLLNNEKEKQTEEQWHFKNTKVTSRYDSLNGLWKRIIYFSALSDLLSQIFAIWPPLWGSCALSGFFFLLCLPGVILCLALLLRDSNIYHLRKCL